MGYPSARISAWIGVLALCLLPSPAMAAGAPQTVWFSPLSPSTHLLTALASSALPVTFTSTTPDVCEAALISQGVMPLFSYWELFIVGLGTCSVTAVQPGDSTYAAASPVTQTFSIPAQLPQTIDFIPLADVILGQGPDIGLSASATSGLGVTFSSLTPSVCTVFIYEDGSAGIMAPTVSIQSAGVCTIAAQQPGNAAWIAAPGVTQSFTITAPAGTPQNINFLQPSTVTFGQTTAVPLNATASSGLPVSFASNTPAVCSVSGASAAIVGVGACLITASQPGNATYLAALPMTVSFSVKPVHPTDVAIDYLESAAPSVLYSPGSLFSIFGNFMASGTATLTPPLPLSSNDTVVTFNGNPCPLLYVSPTQINAQVPVDAALGLATVAVSYSGTAASATMQVSAASPSFFAASTAAVYSAIAQHGDYSFVTAANPARPGEIVTFYGTGIGPVSPVVGSGQPAPGSPNLAIGTAAYSATVNGIDAPVTFLGLTPGLAGVMQLNLQIPAAIPSGFLSVNLTVDGVSSPSAPIPVAGQ